MTFSPGEDGREVHQDLSRLLEPDHRAILRVLPAVVAGLLALLTLLGLVLLWPTGEQRPDLTEIGINSDVYEAVVDGVVAGPCLGTVEADAIPCAFVSFRLRQGPDSGSLVSRQFPVSETSPSFTAGDVVLMDHQPEAEPEYRYNYFDRQRRPLLILVAIAFAIAVVLLGRLRGLAALVGLAVTGVVLLQFVLPAILDGRPSTGVALVGASAIAFVALYAAHGFTRMTTVALLGTLGALALTTGLSWFALGLAEFTGFASEETYILTLVGTIDISGLVLAGVVLGSLGALDDVTVTQASTVWEIKAAQPNLSRADLYRSGIRVGRDHVASTVNTLMLAYAGASMPLLLFFVLANQSLGTVLSTEVMATEVLRTLIGSIGLVAAVPLTTWLAAATADDAGTLHGPLPSAAASQDGS